MLILIPTDNCSSRLSWKKLLVATGGDHYRDAQESDVESKWLEWSPSPTAACTAQPLDLGSEKKNHWTGCVKIGRARIPGCLLLDSISQTQQGRCTHEISTTWLPIQDMHNDHTICHTNMDGGNLIRSTYRQSLREGKSVFFRGAPWFIQA